MKRTRAEGALSPSKAATEAPAKAPRRQKPTTTPRSAAAERAKARAAENAASKGNGGDDKSLAVAAAAAVVGDLMLPSSLPSVAAAAEAEAAAGTGWAAVELGEWWWCLSGVEEEKLSGWFPFVDEDFFCSDSRGGEAASGGLLWEQADHDIWQLQHIHEIPQTVSK